jgi:hypothetical protein
MKGESAIENVESGVRKTAKGEPTLFHLTSRNSSIFRKVEVLTALWFFVDYCGGLLLRHLHSISSDRRCVALP